MHPIILRRTLVGISPSGSACATRCLGRAAACSSTSGGCTCPRAIGGHHSARHGRGRRRLHRLGHDRRGGHSRSGYCHCRGATGRGDDGGHDRRRRHICCRGPRSAAPSPIRRSTSTIHITCSAAGVPGAETRGPYSVQTAGERERRAGSQQRPGRERLCEPELAWGRSEYNQNFKRCLSTKGGFRKLEGAVGERGRRQRQLHAALRLLTPWWRCRHPTCKMMLAARMLYVTIITVAGLGISVGAWAQLRRWFSPKVWHAKPQDRRPIAHDVLTPRGVFWVGVMAAAFVSTLYMYHLLLETMQEKMAGGLTVALAVITAKRYFFYDTPELATVSARGQGGGGGASEYKQS